MLVRFVKWLVLRVLRVHALEFGHEWPLKFASWTETLGRGGQIENVWAEIGEPF